LPQQTQTAIRIAGVRARMGRLEAVTKSRSSSSDGGFGVGGRRVRVGTRFPSPWRRRPNAQGNELNNLRDHQ